MADIFETLSRLDSNKLVDVVKNYKQYGYDDSIRETAVSILASRGIDSETLRLTGNDKNSSYEIASAIFNGFTQDSKRCIGFYVSALLFMLVAKAVISVNEVVAGVLVILFWIAILGYTIFLIRAYLKQNEFYKSIDKPKESGEQIGLFIVGMPLFVFLYFYLRGKMEEDLKLIS